MNFLLLTVNVNVLIVLVNVLIVLVIKCVGNLGDTDKAVQTDDQWR